MTAPDELAFITFPRGQIRDDALALFRNGLRQLVNPDTGQPFTEEEIRYATQPGSRVYIKQDAIDLLGQSFQQRARFTAQQADPRNATSSWLRTYWVPLWLPGGPLPASSSAGSVTWKAPVGSTFLGSTTLGDPSAFTATDPAGNLYQAFSNVTADSTGTAVISMIAVVGGAINPALGTTFQLGANGPLNASTTGSVTGADFSGGFAAEDDSDLVSRLVDVISTRPAAGNAAQFRAWARAASNSVENAWVYSTALNSNSVVVAITAKRGTAQGPTARLVGSTLLALVRAYLTPPGSPVVPSRPFVLVQGCVSDPVSMAMTLSMRKNTAGGWNDSVPWPVPIVSGGSSSTAFCRINALTTQTDFVVTSQVGLPGGATSLAGPNAPSLMIWNRVLSSFERLQVTSITSTGGTNYEVVLAAPASFTVGANDVVSPYTSLGVSTVVGELGDIPLAVQAYFDSLGPGEVVDLTNDPRGAWAYRWPEPSVSSPSDAGQSIITTFFDALETALSNAAVTFLTHSAPLLPSDLSTQGPSLLTIDDFGVYSV